ncbi:hypothetical protein AB1Y20_002989 [Prymnesium parvum]|uniref:O-fucosyltransferase family protein n=1 Tax=Prymnesium parvum TaxID=97485 RepID=A0AB34JBX5_PRYPA
MYVGKGIASGDFAGKPLRLWRRVLCSPLSLPCASSTLRPRPHLLSSSSSTPLFSSPSSTPPDLLSSPSSSACISPSSPHFSFVLFVLLFVLVSSSSQHIMPQDLCSVAFSYALGGGSSVDYGLQNAVDFTVGPLFVHVSVGHNLTRRMIAQVHRLSRVHLNPSSLRVEKNSPGPLAAHLANFEECAAPAMPCATGAATHFVLMAANQVLMRHGVEAWVLSHSLSFCIHQPLACADLSLAELAAPPHAWYDRLGWRADGHSPLWARTQRAVLADDDAAPAADPYFAMYTRLLREGRAGAAWRRAPVNMMSHEGSYYPVALLRHFVRRGLAGSPFAAAFAALQRGEPCSCCQMYRPYLLERQANGSISMASVASCLSCTLGACSFEELLLPTFAWQHHARLISRGSPPLVLRVWVDLNKANASTLRHFHRVAALVANGSLEELPHIFGLKVPHFKMGGVSRKLASVLDPAIRRAREAFAEQGYFDLSRATEPVGLGEKWRAHEGPNACSIRGTSGKKHR